MIIVGHRGARNEAPENTVPGFVHAQANGCMAFELDVQLSKDHELMVFHDTSLKRTTGVRGKLTKYPASQLKQMDARVNTPFWPSPCPIPTLQEVLDSAPLTQHWQFEVKTDSRHTLTILARRLTDFISQNNLERRAVITSGDRWFLSHLSQHYPEYVRGYVAEYAYPDPVGTAKRLGCKYLCLNYRLANPARIEQAQTHGMQVSCWTVNTLEKIAGLASMGVDSAITDIPSKALKHYPSIATQSVLNTR